MNGHILVKLITSTHYQLHNTEKVSGSKVNVRHRWQ